MKISRTLSCLLSVALISGCGISQPTIKRQSKLAYLDVGQSPRVVMSILGEPDVVRASGERRDGKQVKVFEYEIYENYRALGNGIMCPFTLFITCFVSGNGTPYWMQFVDGKLERWGRAGDWQTQIIDQDITIRQK